jgi:hypothetical protein
MDERAPEHRVDCSTERRLARERLLDLAQDASSYLRRHRQTAVRASAALLVAASLAACSPSAEDDEDGVEPLEEEVQSGLPAEAGRYPVRPDSVARDPQGVYYFKTLQSGATTWTQANSSLLRLASGSSSELEVSPDADPTLYLPPEVPVAMVANATEAEQLGALAATPTPSGSGGTSSGSSYSHTRWYPFYAGSFGSIPNTTPAYRNPPPQDISSTNTVSGSDSRATAPPPAERVVGISHGVSGQAGGAGRGSAATLKSGAAAAGKSGGSGSGTAASGKGSSGGLFGARSGGFSTGRGGSSGASSS